MQRVLIVESELLLGAGVESILAGHTGLDVAGISPCDQAVLVEEIRVFRPDIVVMDVVTRFASATNLLALLEDCPKLRVLVMSVDDNRICVYDKREVLVTQVRDLLDIICESQNSAEAERRVPPC